MKGLCSCVVQAPELLSARVSKFRLALPGVGQGPDVLLLFDNRAKSQNQLQ